MNDNFTNELWYRFHTEYTTDGMIIEHWGKVGGTTGDVKVTEYRIL